MENINPIEMFGRVRDSYLSFVLTTVCRYNQKLYAELKDLFLKNNILWTEPVLYKIPKYKTASEREIEQISFNKYTHNLVKHWIQENKIPYIHQIEAWKNITSGKNCIIATGTGSGKTEGFLIPILNHCVNEPKRGVQAIVIYPLKALANDQGKRIGEVLDHVNKTSNLSIKYAIFDGDTGERAPSGALSEINTKEEILQAPPNILLTNYVMLERILLNPDYKNVLKNNDIKFLVLDEIHYYRGAQGIDVSLLIRRLQFYLDHQFSRNKSMQYIGTSATLSNKTGDYAKEIIEFLFKLFNRKFELSEIVTPVFDESYNKHELSKPHFISEIKEKNTFENIKTHTFFRSPSNPIYRCLNCNHLGHIETDTCDKCNSKMIFPILTCRQCGAEYFEYLCSASKLRNPEFAFGEMDIIRKLTVYDRNKDKEAPIPLVLSKNKIESTPLKICGNCLSLYSNEEKVCACNNSNLVEVYAVENKDNNQSALPKPNNRYCPICGFEESKRSLIASVDALSDENCSHIVFDELFMSLPNERKKILLFTDNVQRTSKFAREIEETHIKNIARTYLHKKINSCNEPVSFEDLVHNVISHINRDITLLPEQENGLKEEIYEELISNKKKVASLSNRGIFSLFPIKIEGLKEEEYNKINQIFEVFKEKKHILGYYKLVIQEMKYNCFLDNNKLKEQIYRKINNKKGKSLKNADFSEVNYYLDLLESKKLITEFEGKYLFKEGFLFVVKNEKQEDSINYYSQWINLSNIPLIKSKADTGKTKGDERSKIEKDFKENKGNVNFLVATPTLELGIDIGDLDVVGLLYAPPSAAQYTQRVGRSGREGQSSFSGTFLAKRLIDSMYFDDPKTLVSGVISPPKFDISLEIPAKKSLFSLFLYYTLNCTDFCKTPEMIEWHKISAWESNINVIQKLWNTYTPSFIKFIQPFIENNMYSFEINNLVNEWCEKLASFVILKKSLGVTHNADIYNYFQEAGLLPDYAFGNTGTFVTVNNMDPIKGFSIREVCPPSTLDFNKLRFECEKIPLDKQNQIKLLARNYKTCPSCQNVISISNEDYCVICDNPLSYENEEIIEPKVVYARRSAFSLTQKNINWEYKLINPPRDILTEVVSIPFISEIGQFFKSVNVGGLEEVYAICKCGKFYPKGERNSGEGHKHIPINKKVAIKFKTQIVLLNTEKYSSVDKRTFLNAIISALTIESGCEDGEVSGFSLNNNNIFVFFDDVEGGVGFVECLSKNLKRVLEQAKYLCEKNCCSNGCIQCIGSFWRQRDLLFLDKKRVLPMIEEMLNDLK